MVYIDVAAKRAGGRRGLVASLASLLLAASSFTLHAPGPNPLAAVHLDRLREGDLIFRSGKGWRADAVRLASDAPWSHVGMLVGDARSGWYVVHAAPPEGSDAGGVVETPLVVFAGPEASSRISLFRYAGADARHAAALAVAARRKAAAAVAFDGRFDLASERSLYCTELVARVFAEMGMDLGAVPSKVSLGGVGGVVLLPADLLATGKLVPVG
jgi:hypothetical protein